MKAAWFERFGPAADVLQVGETPTPAPAPGEVLVRLAASGVNPSDVKKRAGSAPRLLDEGFVIPHSDGAGVIEAVGEGVPQTRVGERVWIYQAQHRRRFGTAAQHAAIENARAAHLPAEASMEEGACFGIPLMTAHRCVFADGPVAGLTVLVTGGAGRVGHYAIQWAAHSGARVIATASSDADAQACREAGASAVVSHREKDWPARVLAASGGRKIDRVVEVDFGANLPAVLEMIRTGGAISTYASMTVAEPKLPFYRMMYLDLTVRLVLVYEMPEGAKQQAVADIAAWVKAGRLRHRVARVFPLAEIARAHELIEQGGARGCVVVSTD